MSTPHADGVLRFEGRAMGSPLRLSIPATTPPFAGAAAWEAVVAEFEAAEQAMSRFRETSDVTLVNRSGGWMAVDPRLRRALVAADRARRVTGGLFDPRIVGDLERLGYPGVGIAPRDGRRLARGPDEATVHIRRDGTVRSPVPVDLGGIGKGLALRWARDRAAQELQLEPAFLLDAGGDIVVRGPGPVDGSWLVAIEDPDGGDGPAAVLGIVDGAVATSSVRVNRWTGPDGLPIHHLLDPRTGEPGGRGLRAVTVAGRDPAWCEVRTKQLFLAGPRQIGRLASALDLAAWWFDDGERLSMTPAARQLTRWVAAEASGPT